MVGRADLPRCSGVDRDGDYDDAEREEPECIAVVTPERSGTVGRRRSCRRACRGRAKRDVVGPRESTELRPCAVADHRRGRRGDAISGTATVAVGEPPKPELPDPESRIPTRRTPIRAGASSSNVAARSPSIRAASFAATPFFSMLARLQPARRRGTRSTGRRRCTSLLFVHRVEDMTPGVYAYLRDPAVLDEWHTAMRPEFLWEAGRTGQPASRRTCSCWSRSMSPDCESAVVRPGHRRGRLLQPRHDRALRARRFASTASGSTGGCSGSAA